MTKAAFKEGRLVSVCIIQGLIRALACFRGRKCSPRTREAVRERVAEKKKTNGKPN